MPPTTVAVVPSWNGQALLERNLCTLLDQDRPFARVLVVDNGSGDGSRELLEAMAGVEGLFLDRNRGFAPAVNHAIHAAFAEPEVTTVAVLNNDVTLEPDWHDQAAAVLLSNGEVGACATCLLDASRPSVVHSAGIDWGLDGIAENHLTGQPPPPRSVPPYAVWGASAAAALYRRELFETVGLFDESFFAYQEDVDLALRARRWGWRCLLAPGARGLHEGFGSNRPFPLGGTWADYLNARNRISLLVKSLPGTDWRHRGWRIIAAQLRLLIASPQQARAGAGTAGFLHGILRAPRSLMARRRVSARMAVRRHSNGTLVLQPERRPPDA